MDTQYYTEIQQAYTNAAKIYLQANLVEQETEENKKHLIQIIRSIMLHRDKIMMGGSFVHYLIENDLINAVCKADSICYKHIKLLVLAKKYCYAEDKI
jgi:hypothetical protein